MFSTFIDYFSFSIVTLNSISYYQIFEFDTNIIEILVWIIGSTYRKGNKFEAKFECQHSQQAIFLPLPEIHMGLGVQRTSIHPHLHIRLFMQNILYTVPYDDSCFVLSGLHTLYAII